MSKQANLLQDGRQVSDDWSTACGTGISVTGLGATTPVGSWGWGVSGSGSGAGLTPLKQKYIEFL